MAVSLACLSPASPVRAEERYFALFFGAESQPYRPKYTHTWATIVKLTGEGADLNTYQCEVHTCSWLPATMDVKVWKLRPETGYNFDLHTTICAMIKNGECISEWGAYEIKMHNYERGLGQIQRLDSGELCYRAIDGRSPERNVSNCFHAISDLDPEYGRSRYPLTEAGERVTYEIIERIHERNPDIRQSPLAEWIDHRLGLDDYPITHRRYRDGPP